MTDDELVDYLFNKYGTHAILGVTTGGIFTARYVESTNKSSTNLSNKASLTVEGKVSFDKIFDINPNFSIQEESNEALQVLLGFQYHFC